jgi:hypothetical protein
MSIKLNPVSRPYPSKLEELIKIELGNQKDGNFTPQKIYFFTYQKVKAK